MNDDNIQSRRTMLRGALALGCSALLPAVLSGCDSKKGAEPTTSAPAGSAPVGTPSASTPAPSSGAPASAPIKVAQTTVQYQAQPKDGQKCADCLHFVAESNTCKLVEGQISPEGWCTLWAKKA